MEKNPKFLSLLKERLAGSGVEVILGDALTTFLPSFDVLVSNLPYAIVEAMLQRLKRLRFRAASLIVPSSLAKTITAQKGESNYSKLSFETHLFFDLSMVSVVKSVSYYPEPKTETAIIVLKPKEAQRHPTFVMRVGIVGLNQTRPVGNPCTIACATLFRIGACRRISGLSCP